VADTLDFSATSTNEKEPHICFYRGCEMQLCGVAASLPTEYEGRVSVLLFDTCFDHIPELAKMLVRAYEETIKLQTVN
jgi:hypothetical protein